MKTRISCTCKCMRCKEAKSDSNPVVRLMMRDNLAIIQRSSKGEVRDVNVTDTCIAVIGIAEKKHLLSIVKSMIYD